MTITPLDRHRHENTTESHISESNTAIRERGVEYIYYQRVTSPAGSSAKSCPPGTSAQPEKGVQLHRTAADRPADRPRRPLLGGGVEAAEFTCLPDLDTFAVLPWDTTSRDSSAGLTSPGTWPRAAAPPSAATCAATCVRIHEEFTEETGLDLKSGCEPEMTWYGPGLEAPFRPGSQSPAYHVAHLELYRPVYQKVISYARRSAST